MKVAVFNSTLRADPTKRLQTHKPLRAHKRLTAHKRLKPVSDKRKGQLAKERVVKREMIKEQAEKYGFNFCTQCHRSKSSSRLFKHEDILRSQGGNPLDKKICRLVCWPCHILAIHMKLNVIEYEEIL